MVWNAARRILTQAADADDVMQAVFLVLARDAKSLLKHPSLAGWLHETTCRLATCARTRAVRRSRHEGQVPPQPPANALDEITGRELLGLLDDELRRVPDKYRSPLVLCYLEGRTQDESARQMGCSVSTFKRRLERGRELLRLRLVRRGVTFPAAFLTAALTEKSGMAAVPPSTIAATVQAAMELAAGNALPSSISTSVAGLMQGAGAWVTISKQKVVALMLIGLCVMGGAARVWTMGASSTKQPDVRQTQDRRDAKVGEPTKEGPKKVGTDLYGDPLPEGVIARLGTSKLRAIGARLGFSPDGKTIISVTRGWQVKLWDADTGNLRAQRELPVHPSFPATFLSPDGRILAVQERGFTDGPIDIWEVTTGKQLNRLVPPQQLWRAAFSPSGRELAVAESGRERGIVRLWDVGSGEHRVFKAPFFSADTLAFSPDGKLLAGAHDSGGVVCWESASGQALWHANAGAAALAFTPDGRTLIASPRQRNDSWQCWDAATGRRNDAMKLPDGFFYSELAIAPDGWTMLFNPMPGLVGADRRVRVWDLRSGKLVRTLPTTGMIGPFAPDGKSLLTNDGTLQRWELATGRPLLPDTRALGHRGEITRLRYSKDGRLLASAADDGTIRLWEITTMKPLHALTMQEWRQIQIALSSDSKRLVSVANDGELRVWDTLSGTEVQHHPLRDAQLGETRQYVSGLHLTPDDQTAIVLGYDPSGGVIRGSILTTWDLANRKRKTLIKTPWSNGSDRAFSPDGQSLVSRGEILDTFTGTTRIKLDGAAGNFGQYVYSFDGRLVAGMSTRFFQEGNREGWKPDGSRVWNAVSGETVMRLDTDWVGQYAFTPDARYLATADLDGIRLWELLTGAVALRHQAHVRDQGSYGQSFASCLAYAPDGRSVATGHPDGIILIWAMAPPVGSTSAREFPRFWSDLAASDASKAYQASWRLEDNPAQALPFLKKHLRPAMPAPEEETRQLLTNLDSENFRTREDAARRLRELGDRAATALRETLKAGPSLEKRRRVEALLKTLEASPLPDIIRELRAVAILERIGTRDAADLLRALSGGDAGARLTQQARATLARISRKKN
jgi:RNA polymerase sigma factor (sigma-70 family)